MYIDRILGWWCNDDDSGDDDDGTDDGGDDGSDTDDESIDHDNVNGDDIIMIIIVIEMRSIAVIVEKHFVIFHMRIDTINYQYSMAIYTLNRELKI